MNGTIVCIGYDPSLPYMIAKERKTKEKETWEAYCVPLILLASEENEHRERCQVAKVAR